MADENQTPNENAQNAEAQPEIFFAAPEEQPNVDIQFEVSQKKLPPEGAWEVVVRGTITVTVKEKTMFLVEGKQAGIFDIRNIVEEGVQHLTNVVCPSILYPYLRANLADLITRTGLPPVHLPVVNFVALYQQRLAQAQQQAQQGAAEGVAHA